MSGRRVLVVDDEPLARLRLRKLLDDLLAERPELGAWQIDEAGDAAAARACLAATDVDLLLLDIQMPGTDGLTFAREWREQTQDSGRGMPALIFVTAHGEHALGAFEVAALDYLTKPVRRERLAEALARLAPPVAGDLRQGRREGDPAQVAVHPPPEEETVVVVQDRGRVVRVPASEIVWLKAELKYVTVRTADASWLVDESLAELEQGLGRRFLRIHRNALVAVAALRRLEREPGASGDAWTVQVAPTGEWLAVSRRQVTAVRGCLARREGD